MKTEISTVAEMKISITNEFDIINQMMESGVQKESILSLGYTGNSGRTPKKNQADEWNMSVVLTSLNHMVISEATKPRKWRNVNKMYLGLKMAIEQSDRIYETFPKTRLERETSGDDMRLSYGYVGLMSEISLDDLPVEKRNIMCQIAEALRAIIDEILKPSHERDMSKILNLVGEVVQSADEFHKKNKEVSLFHSLRPVA